MGGSIIYWSIKYSATVKAGFLIISLLSFQLTLTVLSENEVIEIQKLTNNEKVIISRDSIIGTFNPKNRIDQYDFSKIPISFEHEYLIDIGDEAAWFMKKDSIDYTFEYFVVNERDDRAYLQVASYRNIKYAAIQRKNLIENHEFDSNDCKILYSNNFGKILFGVTIGDAARDNITRLSKIQDKWNLKASSSNVRAFLKIN